MGKITQDKKELLINIKKEINDLNVLIDNVLDDKLTMKDMAKSLYMSEMSFRRSIQNGLDGILKSKKIKIFDDKVYFDMLKSTQQPIEKLYQDVLCISDDNILFITSIDHEQIKTIINEILGKTLYDRVSLYYGIDSAQLSYSKIADKYNRSVAIISQSVHKALRVLRHPKNLYKLLLNYDESFIEFQDTKIIAKLSTRLESFKNKCLNIMDIHIEDLGLSTRSFKGLKNCGCNNIEDIIRIIKDGSINKIRNLGSKSIQEIISKLKSLGIAI